MKKHRRYLAVGLAVLSLTLTGCGNEMYELTDEEQALIVQYAAHFVSKYNIYQKDGVVNVEPLEETEEETLTEATELPSGTEGTKPNPDIGDTEVDTEPTDKPVKPGISLAEALGLKDKLSIRYLGSEVAEHIKPGAGYDVNPTVKGNTLYIIKLGVKNISPEALALNHMNLDADFSIAGDFKVRHHQTMLENDFTSYIGTVPAGETVEMLLIFELKPEDAAMLGKPQLKITIEKETKTIEL